MYIFLVFFVYWLAFWWHSFVCTCTLGCKLTPTARRTPATKIIFATGPLVIDDCRRIKSLFCGLQYIVQPTVIVWVAVGQCREYGHRLRDQPQLIETMKREKRKLKNASDHAARRKIRKLQRYNSSRDQCFYEILFLRCLNVSNDMIAISENSLNITIKLRVGLSMHTSSYTYIPVCLYIWVPLTEPTRSKFYTNDS